MGLDILVKLSPLADRRPSNGLDFTWALLGRELAKSFFIVEKSVGGSSL